jgi:hypothetical protein
VPSLHHKYWHVKVDIAADIAIKEEIIMEETLYTGLAVGGPLEGRTVEGRYPGGILFVHKPSNKCWLYDFYAESERFILRPVGYDAFWDTMSDQQKMEVIHNTVLSGMDGARELDYDARLQAANSMNTEVRALPEEVGVA